MEVHQGVSGRYVWHAHHSRTCGCHCSEEWNKIITARNITSHVYDEKTAEDVAAQICNDFLPLLKALGKFYCD